MKKKRNSKPKQKPIEEQGYKELLSGCYPLRKATGKTLYDLTARLTLVYEHDEYRDFCRHDAVDPEEFLDQFVNEIVNRTFVGLMLMYKKYPDRDTWEEGKIQTLYDETLAEVEANEPEVEAGTRPGYKALFNDERKKNEILQNRVNQLEAELLALREQLQIATTSIRDKDMENANLNGRLTEIEKLLEKFRVSEPV